MSIYRTMKHLRKRTPRSCPLFRSTNVQIYRCWGSIKVVVIRKCPLWRFYCTVFASGLKRTEKIIVLSKEKKKKTCLSFIVMPCTLDPPIGFYVIFFSTPAALFSCYSTPWRCSTTKPVLCIQTF